MAGFLRWRNCRGEDRRKNLHRAKSSPPKKRDLPVAPPLSSRSVAAKSDAMLRTLPCWRAAVRALAKLRRRAARRLSLTLAIRRSIPMTFAIGLVEIALVAAGLARALGGNLSASSRQVAALVGNRGWIVVCGLAGLVAVAGLHAGTGCVLGLLQLALVDVGAPRGLLLRAGISAVVDPFRTFKFCGVPPAFSQDKPFA